MGRSEVVAFVVQTRMIFNIFARILIGIDDDAFSLDRTIVEPAIVDVDQEVAEGEAGDQLAVGEEQVDDATLAAEADVLEADDAELEAAALKIQKAARARQARKSQEENPAEDAEDAED